MYKILMLEDEVKTVTTITKGLLENGYDVEYAHDGEQGLAMIYANHYDLIITDILMPKVDGFEVCQKVRQKNKSVPILILSALGLTEDKLKGFELGSDDYLVKPFDFKELLARVKALLKRSTEEVAVVNLIEYEGLTLNIDTKEVFSNSKPIQLTAKEFHLLEYFMFHKEMLLTKEQIIEHVWGLDFDPGTNILEVYISYVRNKISHDSAVKYIQTRKGIGYIFKSH
jgi:two-component system copper resistance phosphate regulon response regulator CusR